MIILLSWLLGAAGFIFIGLEAGDNVYKETFLKGQQPDTHYLWNNIMARAVQAVAYTGAVFCFVMGIGG